MLRDFQCCLILSEIFTNAIRAIGMLMSTFANGVTATVMPSTFLIMAHVLTCPGFFLVLAANCAIAALVMCLCLLETNGVELEQMAKYFAEITNDETFLQLEETLAQTCKMLRKRQFLLRKWQK